jgi:hypothetical protein
MERKADVYIEQLGRDGKGLYRIKGIAEHAIAF